jgi:hypothetical protein
VHAIPTIFKGTKMKTRQELILDFMLALAQNDSFCAGAEDDPQLIYEYAAKFVDVYLSHL